MLFRWIEYIALFWLLPILLIIYRELVAQYAVAIIVLLSCCCTYILWQKGVLQKHWQRMLKLKKTDLTPLLKTLTLVTPALVVLTLILLPERLLFLPLEQPQYWLLLLLLYPILSVIPQELVFRTYFFHRYKKLFKNKSHRAVLGSVSFGLAHFIYGNWIAVMLSFFASLIFSFRFIESKSTAIVVIEHSLMGLLIFTLGLGYYFVAQPIA